MNHPLKLSLALAFTALINTGNVFALTTNIRDGALTSSSNVSFISNSFFSSSNSLISDTRGNISIPATYGTFVINGKIEVSAPSFQSGGNLGITIISGNNGFVNNPSQGSLNSGVIILSGNNGVVLNPFEDGLNIGINIVIGNNGFVLNPLPLTVTVLVPEPASYILFTLGLLALTYRARRFNT